MPNRILLVCILCCAVLFFAFSIRKKSACLFAVILLCLITVPIVSITLSSLNHPVIVINEVCSNNFSIYTDTMTEDADYAELYNPGTSDVSLSGWTFYTGNEQAELYTFGDIILTPGSYLLLVTDSDAPDAAGAKPAVVSDTCIQLAIPCAIAKEGEEIYLRNSAGKTVDYIAVPALNYDTVYARTADGSFNVCSATPGISNESAKQITPAVEEFSLPAYSASQLLLPSEPDFESSLVSISVSRDALYGSDGILLPENIRKTGRLWERECQLDFFTAEKEYVFSQKTGIRICNSSQFMTSPDFNLYTRKIYDDEPYFLYDFWANGDSANRISLNYNRTKEHLLLDLYESCGIPAVNSIPCAVFLNGNYLGDYYLMEQYNAQFIAKSYGIALSELTLLKENQLESGSEYALLEYRSLTRFAEEERLSQQKNYDYICSKINIDSLISYYASQIYLNNYRFTPYRDCLIWRSEMTDETNPAADGTWHYLITAQNDSMTDRLTGNDYTTNTFTHVMEEDPLFAALIENKDFCDAFYEKLLKLSEEDFSISNTELLTANTEALPESSGTDVDAFRTFFRNRAGYLFTYWDALLGDRNPS